MKVIIRINQKMLHLDYGINAKTVLECGSIKTIATYHKPDLIAIRSNFLSPLSFSQSTHFLLRAPFSSFVIFCPSLFSSIPFLLCTNMIMFCKKILNFSLRSTSPLWTKILLRFLFSSLGDHAKWNY